MQFLFEAASSWYILFYFQKSLHAYVCVESGSGIAFNMLGHWHFQTTEETDLLLVTNLHQHHVRVLSFCHWGAVRIDGFPELVEGPPKEAYSNDIVELGFGWIHCYDI